MNMNIITLGLAYCAIELGIYAINGAFDYCIGTEVDSQQSQDDCADNINALSLDDDCGPDTASSTPTKKVRSRTHILRWFEPCDLPCVASHRASTRRGESYSFHDW